MEIYLRQRSGIVCLSQSELSIRDIMQRADEAMYADKARQKGAENVRR